MDVTETAAYPLPPPSGIEVLGEPIPGTERVLTPEALEFVASLHRRFDLHRRALLGRRMDRQAELDGGARPAFLESTADVREASWMVAGAPADLLDRRVEITGPVERKMMINALNSGARVFMADIEDALSPSWTNVIEGQVNLQDAVRRTLMFSSPDGRQYTLNDKTATLLVRPRGWHLAERHVLVDGEPISASLFDFGLYFFHNAAELVARGSAPYFYLPKIESHLEARLWNDIFTEAQLALGIELGTIRATVLIETILAAFEMDEILYELRDHAAGLNAGRWDYLFSIIKRFRGSDGLRLPDRAQVTMTVPFMRAYTELLVRTCHRRGAHAIGGMAAFIPSRRDQDVTKRALNKVAEDKDRESGDGFDGTWVAHPDLVPLATAIFDRVLGSEPHQKLRLREEVEVSPEQLLDFRVPDGTVTEAGVRTNISVALAYLDSWLRGNGAAAINNLMEDAATAEISRSQLWLWRTRGVRLDDGRTFTRRLYENVRDAELEGLGGRSSGRLAEATDLMNELVLSDAFPEFLTLLAYPLLD
ncbi:MAG TPA: malate synthase A [Candidatus Limnocylindrales bacterium]|jgi:malate synthase